MHRLHFSISLLLALLAAVAARGQEAGAVAAGHLSQQVTRRDVSVSVEVDRSQMTTADRLRLTVRTAVPVGTKVKWPEFGAEIGVFLITSDHTEPTWLDAGDRFVTERLFTLEPMLAGAQVIPTLRFDLYSAAGKPDQILTEPIAIVVTTLLPEAELEAEAAAQDLGAIRDIVEPTSATPLWIWVLLAVTLLGGGGSVIIHARSRKRQAQVAPPADEVALAAIEELLATEQWSTFLAGLSAILRRYIEARFDLHAPQRSTEEFLREARGAATLQPHQVVQLDRFLHRADLVKFAAAEVDESEARQAAEEIRAFVLDTRLRTPNGEDA